MEFLGLGSFLVLVLTWAVVPTRVKSSTVSTVVPEAKAA
jgi:hypothetical protein